MRSLVDVVDDSVAGGGADLFDMIPAIAAAGPCGEAGSAELGGGCDSTSRGTAGGGTVSGDFSPAVLVISI